jgi:group I intron endonuclease
MEIKQVMLLNVPLDVILKLKRFNFTDTSGVYGILNLINDKIYIGSSKSIKNRFKWHFNALENNKHHSILLQRAWNKYGEDAFIFFIIERTIDLLLQEQYWLDRFASYNVDCGYNLYIIAGSPANKKLTDWHKFKIGLAQRNRKASEKTKKKMSEAQSNRSQEHKANHAAAVKLAIENRIFSEEARAKITAANLKRGPPSKATRKRMSEAQKKRIARQGYVVKPNLKLKYKPVHRGFNDKS